jgi:hypothetical protein
LLASTRQKLVKVEDALLHGWGLLFHFLKRGRIGSWRLRFKVEIKLDGGAVLFRLFIRWVLLLLSGIHYEWLVDAHFVAAEARHGSKAVVKAFNYVRLFLFMLVLFFHLLLLDLLFYLFIERNLFRHAALKPTLPRTLLVHF